MNGQISRVPAVLLYWDGEPPRIVQRADCVEPWIVSDVIGAVLALADGEGAALVSPEAADEAIDELRERGVQA